ncbi:hypothetical protein CPB84DRAFT_370583 [Gymnopilus junonius]|uniref:Uncharacterized protein n=1 Tax=Gymnopilus junonius TaxID=109634 RepID=A0A9P5NAR2_GYMJU|nr:hypothetical protein CPB84DRAFT_370583 [Gymnopilus junonius]
MDVQRHRSREGLVEQVSKHHNVVLRCDVASLTLLPFSSHHSHRLRVTNHLPTQRRLRDFRLKLPLDRFTSGSFTNRSQSRIVDTDLRVHHHLSMKPDVNIPVIALYDTDAPLKFLRQSVCGRA